MDAAVLAAGRGQRCWPLTATRPKPALPILDETLLTRVLRQVSEAGLRRVVVVAPAGDDLVPRLASEAADVHRLSVAVVHQDPPRGTGDAVAQAARVLGKGRLLVVHGDVVLEDGAIQGVVAADRGSGVVGTARVEDASAFGAVDVAAGEVRAIREKSTSGPAPVHAGCAVLPETIWEVLPKTAPSPRGEVELTDAINALARQAPPVAVDVGYWNDVGWPWDLLSATERLIEGRRGRIEGDVHRLADVDERATVLPGARIRSGVVIEGPVIVGRGAVVGPNAYVRGATVLGSETKVGQAVEIKSSILLDRARVPHLSYVGDSILGEGVNLGAGTVVANLRHDDRTVRVHTQRGVIDTGRRKFGVVLGDHVHTGINCTLNVGVLLPAEAAIPPGEVVRASLLPK